MMTKTLIATALALLAAPVFADGSESTTRQGDAVSAQATVNGTLHAGHIATVANGKYNTPSAAYHLDAEGKDLVGTTGYRSGPGGYAETKKASRP